MRTRIITGVVAIALLLPILIFSDMIVLDIALSACCLISVFEILKCVGTVKKLWLSIPLLVLSPLTVLAIRPLQNTEGAPALSSVAFAVIMAVTLYLLAVMVFSKNQVSVEDISVSGFLTIYITAALSAIILLRDANHGAYTYLLIFIGAWVTDTFAYFTGMLFGKHKLIPEISPKKTIEGSIGGTLCCGGAFVLVGYIVNVWKGVESNLLLLFAYGLVIAIVSQIGDLCMSAIKRRYDIKDFGKIFPGHGGMLDRFDSILAVSVALLLLNGITSIFN